ncbi:MAG TPA: dihydrofolate reductase family protein [Gemmatimonadaceae bacterium]|nr:dihydrofolate reductase family protein [Gemmatimonadaceae bacterium]
MKASIFIATSLDGFIARPDGDIDWLPVGEGNPADGDYGFSAFIETVDALVMGRGTFEKALTFGTWPYKKTVVVLSHHPVEIPPDIVGFVEWMKGTPQEVIERLAARGVKHIYVDGGRTIQGFLEAGMLQRLIITQIPVLIGQGIPLFGPLRRDVRLRHVSTRTYTNGLVQNEYLVLG